MDRDTVTKVVLPLIAYFSFDFVRRRRGTFAPERLASDNPIAIACLRLFTLRPERPLRSVPRLRSCMARFTFCEAFLLYLGMVSPSVDEKSTTKGIDSSHSHLGCGFEPQKFFRDRE